MTLFGRKQVWATEGSDGPTTIGMIEGATREPDAAEENSRKPGGPQPVSGKSPEPAASLDAVLAADIPIAWDEAVSIIEGLCEAVQGAVLRSIPSGREIFLTSAGNVSVRTGAGTPDPEEAARRLHELLGKGTVPAPLRLFASQAVTGGQYGSIGEFAQGLSYFTRPGGRSRIVAVYERYMAQLASMPFPSEEQAALPSKAPVKVRRSRQWHRAALLGLAGCVVAGSIVSAGYLLWQGLSRQADVSESVPESPPAAEPAKSPTAAPVRRLRSSGATRGAPAPGQPSSPGPGAGEARVAPETTGGTRAGAPPSPVPLDIAVTELLAAPAPAAGNTGQASNISGAAAAAPPTPATSPAVPEAATDAADPERVYSATDAGIVPATLVREQRLPPALVASDGTPPLQMELIVSAEGTVERARFVVAPRRMADMMLLSSAKTWTFNPALKDGKPVRSRVLLSWSVAP